VSDSNYVLKLQDFEMTLAAVETNRLNPHEETIPELLKQLTHDFETQMILRNPIIVDKRSLVVLDGNHRVEVFNNLGYNHIIACLVDYMDPRIRVGCWYRTLDCGNSQIPITDLLEDYMEFNSDLKTIVGVVNSTKSLAVVLKGRAYISSPHSDLQEAYEALRLLDNRLRKNSFGIGYTSETEAEQRLLDDTREAFVVTPTLSKMSIVEMGQSRRRFPSKTSRHIIPARPMGIDFPLQFLKGPSLYEANRAFFTWVSRRKIHQLPPRQEFEGRRYEESLLLLR